MITPLRSVGHVPVLLMLDSQRVLVRSALGARAGQTADIDWTGLDLPRAVTIDPSFPAVPVGDGRVAETEPPDGRKTEKGDGAGAEVDIRSFEPRSSKKFIVRCFLETDDPTSVPEQIEGVPLFSDPMLAPALTHITDRPVGDIKAVRAKLDTAKLKRHGLDGAGVAVAIVDTGIYLPYLKKKLKYAPKLDVANSWTPDSVATPPGLHRIGHGTMCAFNALLAAPKVTLLDFPALIGRAVGDHSVSGTLSQVLQAYTTLMARWTALVGPGSAQKYKALVINNSWGIYHPSCDFPVGHPGRYIDNPNHALRFLTSPLALAGADILFAAGNCGSPCPSPPCLHRKTGTINGANAYTEVLTVAACDVNGLRTCYSSQGPSMTGMPQEKPDLTAYAHFLGSEVAGRRRPDAGTSAACPVAAGCVAALRTRQPPASRPPAALFAALRASARSAGAGWNGDTGHGIINPVAAGRSLGLIP